MRPALARPCPRRGLSARAGGLKGRPVCVWVCAACVQGVCVWVWAACAQGVCVWVCASCVRCVCGCVPRVCRVYVCMCRLCVPVCVPVCAPRACVRTTCVYPFVHPVRVCVPRVYTCVCTCAHMSESAGPLSRGRRRRLLDDDAQVLRRGHPQR